MSTTEAADLARIILDDTETDRHMDLYTLTVIEARTLARAVTAWRNWRTGWSMKPPTRLRRGTTGMRHASAPKPDASAAH